MAFQQISRTLVDAYDLIVMEKLDAKRMSETRHSGLNKSIRDAAWNLMQRLIAFKAVEAGKQYREVNPYHTSQLCSGCGSS
ncbi:MAG TPA: transposase [Phototrophicaceae bacterium]|nr:transposase [Phototrophicaceae bacterium]